MRVFTTTPMFLLLALTMSSAQGQNAPAAATPAAVKPADAKTQAKADTKADTSKVDAQAAATAAARLAAAGAAHPHLLATRLQALPRRCVLLCAGPSPDCHAP